MRKTKCLFLLVVLFQTSSFLLAQNNSTSVQSSNGADLRGVQYNSIQPQNVDSPGEPDNKSFSSLTPITSSCLLTTDYALEPLPVTVGGYITFLRTVASKSDTHHLYTSAMERQILRSEEEDHFNYSIIDGVGDKEFFLNLTLAEARHYCNWIENGCLTEKEAGDAAIASTEKGSYDFNGDEVSISSEAKYYLFEHSANEDGTIIFFITTEPIESSPMMMFRLGEKAETKSAENNEHLSAGNSATEERRRADEKVITKTHQDMLAISQTVKPNANESANTQTAKITMEQPWTEILARSTIADINNAPKTITAIGRVRDLQSLQPEVQSLLPRLPDLGSPKANLKQNFSVLRQEIQDDLPILDVSLGNINGKFLNEERKLLQRKGYHLDASTGYWRPPNNQGNL